MSHPSPEEQRAAIRKIMGYDRKRSYNIYGLVYEVKEELKKLGAFFDRPANTWRIQNIPGDHPIHKFVKDNEGVYLKEVR